ncbi:MAG: PqqD family protein [Candidatus Omnitrophota bacterium]
MADNIIKMYLSDARRTYYSIVNGEAVVLIPGKKKVCALGPVGTRVWELADGAHRIEEIVDILRGEFEVDRDTIVKDLIEFVDDLSGKRLLRLSKSKKKPGAASVFTGVKGMKRKKTGGIMKRRYAKSPSVISKTMADEVVLAVVRGRVGDLESVYTLSGAGVRIWQLIDGRRKLEDIKKIIVTEFAVEPQEARNDLVSLVSELDESGCIRLRE